MSILITNAVPATPTAFTDPAQFENGGLEVSSTGGAATITVTQADGATAPTTAKPVLVGIRNPTATNGGYNVRSITSGTVSNTIISGVTLGYNTAPATATLYHYLIDVNGLGAMAMGTAGVILDESQLQSAVFPSSVVTISIASPAVVSFGVPHNFNAGDAVVFTTTGSLPTGITAGVVYYVVSPTLSTLEIAATQNGTAINTSGSQSGQQRINVAGSRLTIGGVGTVVSNAAIRLVGTSTYSITTVGTWPSPSDVALYPESKVLSDLSMVVAPTSQSFMSGSGTYFTPTEPSPLYLRVTMVGGGGGTSGAGAGATTPGTNGSDTSFGSFTAVGGNTTINGGSGGSGTAVVRIPGGYGSNAAQNGSFSIGGNGGGSTLGYPTFPPMAVSPGTAVAGVAPSSGYGAGAAGPTGDLATFGGVPGAGGGEYAEVVISSPAASYSYSVGAGGSAGTGTVNGAAGGGGIVIVQEFYT